MRIFEKPTVLLLATLATSVSLQSVLAQPIGAQTMRGRIQQEIQSIVNEKTAEALNEIEQRLAATDPAAVAANNRRIQAALNFFGFKSGPVDGIVGIRTRSAMNAFQNYMGFPASRVLEDDQTLFLLESYEKAQTSPSETRLAAIREPDGIRGLLKAFQAEQAAETAVAATGDVSSEQTAALAPIQPSSPATDADTSSPFVRAELRPLAVFCAEQFELAAAGNRPKSRLSEVRLSLASGPIFCEAKESAKEQSAALISSITDFSSAEIAEQCFAFEPAFTSLVEQLPTRSPAEVLDATSRFIERTELDAEGLKGIAQVCLGVGYRSNRIQLAIGSALILTALDYMAYAEFPEHHLALGFGVEKEPSLAKEWFNIVLQNEPDVSSEFEAQAAMRLKKLQEAMSELEAVVEIDGGVLPSFLLPQ
ncbi:MAG: peptidoglycan-binding domain-containing protein [Pseudomonadota bacterium]